MTDEDCSITPPPELEELTNEEILKISDQFDIDGTEDVTKGMPLDTFWDSYQPQQLIAFARAIIAADRARAYLSQPEPEGPTLDYDDIDVPPWYHGDDSYIYKEGYAAGWRHAAIAAELRGDTTTTTTTTQENNQ